MKVVLFSLLALGLVAGSFADKIVNCYWGTWANYRQGNGRFVVEDVDPKLCTHLSYTFFGITPNGEINMLDNWLDMGLKFIEKTIALKQKNPNLKVIATVGGWNEGSTKYSTMAANPASRKKFIDSTLKFILDHGFDGLDLDWEYPAQRGGSPADKKNFVTLLKELKAAFKPHNLELSIAVGVTEASASQSYDIPAIAKELDHINLMTYDLAGSWDGKTGFNAGLKGNGQNNIESSVNYWLNAGAPADKLVLGIASYGRTFTLQNPSNAGVGAPTSGGGTAGPYTREGGFLGYNEICEDLSSWKTSWDPTAACPYAVKGNQWVGYDNVESINKKMDFLLSKKLAGAMMWSIETDDFKGICGPSYPLLNAVNKKLRGVTSSKPSSPAVKPPVSQPTQAPSQPAPQAPSSPSSGNCSADGFYRDPTDCSRYYRCVSGEKTNYQCPAGLKFDQNAGVCNWAAQVSC